MDKLEQMNVGMQGQPDELKWCLHFKEDVMPMVTNSTNRALIAQVVGSEETDDWPGKQIVLFHDPTVSYGGKMIGGIRVRAPRNTAPRAVASAPQPKLAPAPPPPAPAAPQYDEPTDEDEVPF